MSRPRKNRSIFEPPLFSDFKPVGVFSRYLKGITLRLDEFEAFRLADFIGMTHEEAAAEMDISRPTFTRLIETARKKVAEMIIEGKRLTIGGGEIHFRNNLIRCSDCGHIFRININQNVAECPVCHSTRLINLAGGFGHGRCCGQYFNQKGGYHAKRRQNRT